MGNICGWIGGDDRDGRSEDKEEWDDGKERENFRENEVRWRVEWDDMKGMNVLGERDCSEVGRDIRGEFGWENERDYS